MYNVNLLLRTIVSIVFFVIVIFLDNYYLFWLLLFYMLLLSIADRNLKSLLVNFAIALILLFCYYTSKIKLILKILFVVNILVTYICSFRKNEKKNIKYRAMYSDSVKSRKKLFYDMYSEKILESNKEMAFSTYGDNVTLGDKVSKDLDNFYIYGRTKFYGYSDKITNFSNSWNWYDTLFLLVAIFVIVLICIYW